MVDVAFFGKPVPLAGQRRPASNVIARTSTPKYERLNDGRYLVTHWMRNRCENYVECGSRSVYVMDDHGDLVFVESWARAWW
ncbi:MAG: hypothetical protein RSG22_18300 [Comamonas sp.]